MNKWSAASHSVFFLFLRKSRTLSALSTELRLSVFFFVVRDTGDGICCKLGVGGCCNCDEEGKSTNSNSDGEKSSVPGSEYSHDGPGCGVGDEGISTGGDCLPTGDDCLGKDDGDSGASEHGCGGVILVLVGLNSSVLSKNDI